MRLRGQHLIRSLLGGGNTVVMAGSYVVKRLGGRDARRRYNSELLGRMLLQDTAIEVVPVVARFGTGRVIVMSRAAGQTLEKELTEAKLDAFVDHVIVLAEQVVEAIARPGYYWVDAPGALRQYDTYADFLLGEFTQTEAEFSAAYPHVDRVGIRARLRAAQAKPRRVLVLTDVAPKNVLYRGGRFTHLDLEATLVGAPEFLLVKAAVNLATDLGDRCRAPEIRRRLLERCGSAENARAALTFCLVRRLLYEARAGGRDARPLAALSAALEGSDLDDAIGQLERQRAAEPAALTHAAGG